VSAYFKVNSPPKSQIGSDKKQKVALEEEKGKDVACEAMTSDKDPNR
jgi:hypothetical protein